MYIYIYMYMRASILLLLSSIVNLLYYVSVSRFQRVLYIYIYMFRTPFLLGYISVFASFTFRYVLYEVYGIWPANATLLLLTFTFTSPVYYTQSNRKHIIRNRLIVLLYDVLTPTRNKHVLYNGNNNNNMTFNR